MRIKMRGTIPMNENKFTIDAPQFENNYTFDGGPVTYTCACPMCSKIITVSEIMVAIKCDKCGTVFSTMFTK